ncbi:MAG: thermonuclease family protein [Proteobacteria bacterium]|nr:thermonuclease family protein [Pseudomonadota bacterium]
MSLLAKTSRGAIAASAGLMATACGGDPLDRLAEGERGRVETVFFGGRMRLEDGTELRLAGVDVPGRGEAGAAEAKAALEGVVGGKPVALLYGGPRRDGFGRAVAHVRTLGRRRWAQGDLLQAGLARVNTTADDRALAGPMLRLEARARAAGRGLWTSPEWRVRLPQEIREPGFQLVEGRLGRLDRRFAGSAARLGDGALTLEASGRATADMAAAGAPFDALAGRLIRVRGVVRRRGAGWVLEVDHPERIEPLTNVKRASRRG